MIGDIFRDGHGIDGITLDNLEMIYDPLVSGVGSVFKRKQQLVSQGMALATAEDLLTRYLNKQAESSTVVTLMDLFSSRKAKSALNNPRTSLKDVCLNFQS